MSCVFVYCICPTLDTVVTEAFSRLIGALSPLLSSSFSPLHLFIFSYFLFSHLLILFFFLLFFFSSSLLSSHLHSSFPSPSSLSFWLFSLPDTNPSVTRPSSGLWRGEKMQVMHYSPSIWFLKKTVSLFTRSHYFPLSLPPTPPPPTPPCNSSPFSLLPFCLSFSHPWLTPCLHLSVADTLHSTTLL